mgnify:CR=1 FL=1
MCIHQKRPSIENSPINGNFKESLIFLVLYVIQNPSIEVGPFGVNLVALDSNKRLQDDLEEVFFSASIFIIDFGSFWGPF